MEPLCESCVYYDYDEVMDQYICRVSIDEDDYEKHIAGQYGGVARRPACPYYRYHDEYKSVRRQNYNGLDDDE